MIGLVGDDLDAGVQIGQFDGIASDSGEGIEYDLRAMALTGDVLGNLLGRIQRPRLLIHLDSLIELLEEDVPLVPVLVELELAVLLLLNLLGLVLLRPHRLLQQRQLDADVRPRNYHQQMALVGANRNQEMLSVAEDGAVVLINRAHPMIIPQLDIHSLSKLTIDLLHPPIQQLLPLLFLLKLHTVLPLCVSAHVGTVIGRKNLILKMVVVRIVRLACLLVYRQSQLILYYDYALGFGEETGAKVGFKFPPK